MSLIDEALKRARQEASRQDAAQREARYARVPVYVPPDRRARAWVLPSVVAACLVLGVVGGLWLARPGRHAAAGPEPTAASAPRQAQAGSPHPLAPSPATPRPQPGRGGTPAAAGEKPRPEKPVERGSKAVESPASPVVPAASGVEKPPTAPVAEERHESRSPSPGEGEGSGGRGGQGVRDPAPAVDAGPVVELPQTPPAAPESFVRTLPLAGGGALQLNGIAFSAKPVALFGDKVVAPGESIGGFTVVEIEAQRVKLQGAGRTVYVALK